MPDVAVHSAFGREVLAALSPHLGVAGAVGITSIIVFCCALALDLPRRIVGWKVREWGSW